MGSSNIACDLVLDVLAVTYHTGTPGYHIVRFRDSMYGGVKIAIIFRQLRNCVVVDADKLAAGDIWDSSSYPGAEYESVLRQQICDPVPWVQGSIRPQGSNTTGRHEARRR
jgi:hypothetical protein